jgi:preprotein translocase subunit SecG
MLQIVLQLALFFMALFLVLIILVQRGRGGGLAGALGGPGGSSAFGAKAGDAFTKITMYAAGAWFVLCILASVWGGGRMAGGGDDAGLSNIRGASRPAATGTDSTGDENALSEAGSGGESTPPASDDATPPADSNTSDSTDSGTPPAGE